MCVGAGDAVQAVKEDFERRGGREERFDKGEIKYFLEEDNIIGDRVDDGYFEWTISEIAFL